MCWHQKSCTSTWKSWFPALCHRGPPKKNLSNPKLGPFSPHLAPENFGWNRNQLNAKSGGSENMWAALVNFCCGDAPAVRKRRKQGERDWFVRTTPPLPRPPTTGPFLWDNHRPCIYIYIYMQAYVYTYLSCKLDCVHVPVYNHVIRVYCILCIYIYIYTHSFSCIWCYVHIGINRIIDTFATTYSVLLAGSFKQLH